RLALDPSHACRRQRWDARSGCSQDKSLELAHLALRLTCRLQTYREHRQYFLAASTKYQGCEESAVSSLQRGQDDREQLGRQSAPAQSPAAPRCVPSKGGVGPAREGPSHAAPTVFPGEAGPTARKISRNRPQITVYDGTWRMQGESAFVHRFAATSSPKNQ